VREERIGVAGSVVATLRRSVDVDPVKAAERELGGGVVIEQRRLSNDAGLRVGQRTCRIGRLRALKRRE
jgi:hypothetical protein